MPDSKHLHEARALVEAERKRQVQIEGWKPEHDDTHTKGELLKAARAYSVEGTASNTPVPDFFPFEPTWWKPTDSPVRNLTKAGALRLAEVHRLRRRGGLVSDEQIAMRRVETTIEAIARHLAAGAK